MHLKSLTIDGFKTYTQRTVIDGFDKQFTAITGLNGSGKSNMLDALCFLLGITELSRLRVKVLDELIYKAGTADISQASVTAVFDNHDPFHRPVGYENIPQITVTRQVFKQGKEKTKFLINGSKAKVSDVHELFCSVHMNVNNPHFLIMQGKITKVLSMKPKEILAMLEEAVGTGYYEEKKMEMLRTFDKKEAKLQEIEKIINSEIAPKIQKFRNEREKYNKFRECEQQFNEMKMLLSVYEYVSRLEAVKKMTTTEIPALQKQLMGATQELDAKQYRVAALTEEMNVLKNTTNKITISDELKSSLKQHRDQLNRENGAFKQAKDNVDYDEEQVARIDELLQTATAKLQAKRTEYETFEAKFGSARDAATDDDVAHKRAVDEFRAAQIGMVVNDEGITCTLPQQLSTIDAKLTMAKGTLACRKQRLVDVTQNVTDLKKQLDKLRSSPAWATYEQCEAKLSECQRRLDATKAAEAQNADRSEAQREKLNNDLDNITRECERVQAKLTPLVQKTRDIETRLRRAVRFQYTKPYEEFKANKIYGRVCTLFKVKDPNMCCALEVIAGGKLSNVVVDNDQTSTDLIVNGHLEYATTFAPMNKINRNARPISAKVLKIAESVVGKDNVWSAMSCIEYDPCYEHIMTYVFGQALICRDIDMAEKLAYFRSVACTAVTLIGDVVHPHGLLSGGDNTGIGDFLTALHHLKDINNLQAFENDLDENKSKIRELRAAIQQISSANCQLVDAQCQLTDAKYALEMNAIYKKKQELTLASEEREQLEGEIQRLIDEIAPLEKRVAELRLEMNERDNVTRQQNKLVAMERNVETLRNKAEKSKALWDKHEKNYELLKVEIEICEKKLIEIENERATVAEKLKNARAKMEQAESAMKIAQDNLNAVERQADEEMQQFHKSSEVLSHIELERRALIDDVNKCEKEIKKLTECTDAFEANVNELKTIIAKLRNEIAQDALDNLQSKARELSEADAHELKKRFDELNEYLKEHRRAINVKAIAMLRGEEKRFDELNARKDTCFKDKQSILAMIEDLDVKKLNELQRAFDKVNVDFASIFTTMLPGASARLAKLQNAPDLTRGLEINVQLGNVWRENLQELSGGQRSLAALALILAMLKFKPAPMYILDEVDAALDLSHTQNLGETIRNHFTTSQFIIVSLKNNMFRNANVLFNVSFENNTSVVKRTSAQSAK